MKIGGRQSVN